MVAILNFNQRAINVIGIWEFYFAISLSCYLPGFGSIRLVFLSLLYSALYSPLRILQLQIHYLPSMAPFLNFQMSEVLFQMLLLHPFFMLEELADTNIFYIRIPRPNKRITLFYSDYLKDLVMHKIGKKKLFETILSMGCHSLSPISFQRFLVVSQDVGS